MPRQPTGGKDGFAAVIQSLAQAQACSLEYTQLREQLKQAPNAATGRSASNSTPSSDDSALGTSHERKVVETGSVQHQPSLLSSAGHMGSASASTGLTAANLIAHAAVSSGKGHVIGEDVAQGVHAAGWQLSPGEPQLKCAQHGKGGNTAAVDAPHDSASIAPLAEDCMMRSHRGDRVAMQSGDHAALRCSVRCRPHDCGSGFG